MSRICAICGKEPMHGQYIRNRHSGPWKFRGPRTKRLFMPNLQPIRMQVKGVMKRSMVCTKCLKAGKPIQSI